MRTERATYSFRVVSFLGVATTLLLVLLTISGGSHENASNNDAARRTLESTNKNNNNKSPNDTNNTAEDVTTTNTISATDRLNTFMNFLAPSDASFGLKTIDEGLFLSDNLQARMIALAGHKVHYANGKQSELAFHPRADGGDVFADPRPGNPDGWIYVSNSEVSGGGGVGAITFDKSGGIIDYKMILTSTTMNCNGGRTHFGAWVSCEEDFGRLAGRAWLTDPTGERTPKPISLGSSGGVFEAFAYDIRDETEPYFYLTEDRSNGAIQRWTPTNPDFSMPWEMLTGAGTTDYLVLSPGSSGPTSGTFSWTTNKATARNNAQTYFPNTEGMDISGNMLFYVSKANKLMYELNLDTNTYTRVSTQSGLFEGQPDHLRNILADEDGDGVVDGTMLYFTEDGGSRSGIHARDADGNFYTILESDLYIPETTGLSITPDGKRMYFAYQVDGVLFELTRKDGQSFRATTLNLKTHPSEMTDAERRSRHRLYS